MAINVYLNFDGNAREAIEFYAKVFQTNAPEVMSFGDSPQNPNFPLPDVAKDLVMHGRIDILGSTVMFSDVFPGMPFTVGNNINLSIVTSDLEKLKTSFEHLREGGNVTMELQETFWSKCYGQLKDKFGINWQFSHEEAQNA